MKRTDQSLRSIAAWIILFSLVLAFCLWGWDTGDHLTSTWMFAYTWAQVIGTALALPFLPKEVKAMLVASGFVTAVLSCSFGFQEAPKLASVFIYTGLNSWFPVYLVFKLPEMIAWTFGREAKDPLPTPTS